MTKFGEMAENFSLDEILTKNYFHTFLYKIINIMHKKKFLFIL